MTMERATAAITLGLLSVLIWPTLPSYWVSIILLLLGAILCKIHLLIACFLIGLSVCILSINYHFHDLKYLLAADSSIKGTIVSLPEQGKYHNRFYFKLSSIMTATETVESDATLLLRWPGEHNIYQGQQWQFSITAKPFSGLFNQGSFNYQRYLLGQHIIAQATVRDAINIVDTPDSRGQLSQQLDSWLANLANKRFIKALIIGDKRAFSTQDWQTMRHTGTSHLFAISGLHLGLIALFVIIITNPLIKLLIVNQWLAQFCSTLLITSAISFYAYLAGFSHPTLRALLMILIGSVFLLLRQRIRLLQLLVYLLFVLGVLSPLSFLSQGLWLSLFAVLVVFATVLGRHYVADKPLTWLGRCRRWFIDLLKLQLALSLGLYGVQLVFFGGVSVLAPLANMVAVPIITLVVLPMVLLASIMRVLLDMTGVSNALFDCADALLTRLFDWLTVLATIPWSWLSGSVTFISSSVLLLSTFFFISNLFVRISAVRYSLVILFSVVLAIAAKYLQSDDDNWRIDFLDVGHGNSAVVIKNNRAIIVDTGNKFGQESTMAQMIISPFLRAQFITEVDFLFITHRDSDHSAGESFLMQRYPMLTSISNRHPYCQGHRLYWQGLTIELTSTKHLRKKSHLTENNKSCLIRIYNRHASVLFVGDIEAVAEKKLIDQLDPDWQPTVLQIPHHGSKSSSTKQFVNFIAPQIGIVSTKAYNHWHLPSATVTQRYAKIGTQLFNTATSGQITIEFSQDTPNILTYRGYRSPFWYNSDLSFGHYNR